MKDTYKTVEQDLEQFAIEAHGGLERWKRFTTLSVHGINGGALGRQPDGHSVPEPLVVSIDLDDFVLS